MPTAETTKSAPLCPNCFCRTGECGCPKLCLNHFLNLPKPVQESSTEGFDVTCVIGHVSFGNGEISPQAAAFQLIAQHDANGTFSFPDVFGDFVTVTVEYPPSHFRAQEPVTKEWKD